MANNYDFGLVGLGVMGRNFILNVADHGFSAYGLDTDINKVEALRAEGEGKAVDGSINLEEFISNLSTPRKIMMLVPAGNPVDAVINDLLPFLEKGDLIIDGGNSHFRDTDRRFLELSERGIHFMGSGVSGGSKGARFGPSIMPGGNPESYALVKPIFEATAAKVDGEPCVDYMGAGSAGNYVKMVHNGIEYGLMQLISEIYSIMKSVLGMSNSEIQKTFEKWNEGRLKSFLIEITMDIFQVKDDQSSGDLVDIILDKAKQKGTGKWTSQCAMDLGVSIPSIDAAVSMRQLSSLKEDRVEASRIYQNQIAKNELSVQDLESALYFAFIITYAQGMHQLKSASNEYNYGLNLENIAKIWRGGCIIRARLLEDIRVAFKKNPDLSNLLLDENFASDIKSSVIGTRNVIKSAVSNEIPIMSLSACLNYFDAFKTSRLPLNLIQAQRDYFGSHTYERIDKKGIFHTENWK